MDAEYWVRTYDEVGSEYTEAQPLDVFRKETIERVIGAIKTGDVPMPVLDLDSWAHHEFEQHVGGERNRRSHRLSVDVDYLLGGFEEDGAYLDPVLSQVHRLGDGTDKVLRLWTKEDWHSWAYGRLADAAKVSAAAHEAMKRAEELIARMTERGVNYTGDLYS